jgi:hypothetical protein
MSVSVKLAIGGVLLAWGFADYLFPHAVLRVQSVFLTVPSQSEETLAGHKRRMGLVCILTGLLAVIVAVA